MKGFRRLCAGLVMAALLATGLGTVTLEAKKPGGGGGNAAICAYLEAIMAYPNVNPYILALVMQLYEHYGCAT